VTILITSYWRGVYRLQTDTVLFFLTYSRTSPWKLDRIGENLADGSGKSEPVEFSKESLQWCGLAALKRLPGFFVYHGSLW